MLHSVVITVGTVEITGLEMKLGTRITVLLGSSKKQELLNNKAEAPMNLMEPVTF